MGQRNIPTYGAAIEGHEASVRGNIKKILCCASREDALLFIIQVENAVAKIGSEVEFPEPAG